ncbi:MAG: acyl carrier protein [Firmicutes bacterium]|nr:acyl carrier protein [Bacillota bacterium]
MESFEQLKQVLVESRGIVPSKITMEASFEALGLDSLDAVDILMTAEEKYGLRINLDDGAKTIADIVRAIDKAKTKK